MLRDFVIMMTKLMPFICNIDQIGRLRCHLTLKKPGLLTPSHPRISAAEQHKMYICHIRKWRKMNRLAKYIYQKSMQLHIFVYFFIIINKIRGFGVSKLS